MSAYKGLGFDDKVLKFAIDNDCIICGIEASKYPDVKALKRGIETVLKTIIEKHQQESIIAKLLSVMENMTKENV